MDFKICPNCGQVLTKAFRDGRNRMLCRGCDYVQYKNPLPAAAVILLENDRILLVKRKFEPRAGYWSLPAGFIELDETPEAAAIRETFEETGILVKIRQLFTVTGTCDETKTQIVLIIYHAEKVGGVLTAGDDADAAEFFHFQHLPKEMAFSSHQKAIDDFIKKIKN